MDFERWCQLRDLKGLKTDADIFPPPKTFSE